MNRIKQLSEVIIISNYRIIDNLSENEELKIHKILRNNPFTQIYNMEIEKKYNGLFKEFYIFNNFIEESLIFLIKNIKKYDENLNDLSHLLTHNLTKLNLI